MAWMHVDPFTFFIGVLKFNFGVVKITMNVWSMEDGFKME